MWPHIRASFATVSPTEETTTAPKATIANNIAGALVARPDPVYSL
jgi:hypothetical protein